MYRHVRAVHLHALSYPSPCCLCVCTFQHTTPHLKHRRHALLEMIAKYRLSPAFQSNIIFIARAQFIAYASAINGERVINMILPWNKDDKGLRHGPTQ